MNKVSRRKFLGSAGLAAGAVALINGSALGQLRGIAGAAPGNDSLGRLGWDAFLPYVNTDFSFYKVIRGGDSVNLKLVNMSDSRPLAASSRRLRQENFVLRFASNEELPLGDATYAVNHFNLGDFDLFVTRAGRDRSGTYFYNAVINRVTVAEKVRIWRNRF